MNITFQLPVTLYDTNTLRINVPCPDNYPDTEFKQRIKGIGLVAYIECTYDTERNTVFITEWYVFTKTVEVASELDKTITKGLGKKMVYDLLRHVVDHGLITEQATMILHAKGGRYTEECKQMVALLSDEELNSFLQEYPGDSALIHDSDDKKKTYCMINDNAKLVTYYKTYGLEAIHGEKGTDIKMSGSVREVLYSCKNK